MHASYRRLQQYAIAISILSIVYNGAEGAISIAFGSESSSRSLIFFGLQSGLEVISASLVVWRFRKIAKPGEEKSVRLAPRELRIEKIVSASIGGLLAALALATEITAIVALALQQKPDSSNSSLIISASALVIMIFIWLPKRYLARALDSSAMKGEATCSLSCIQITVVLFVGSLVRRLWENGWWVDSATSLFLGMLFGWEAYKTIKWVRDPAFDGGCCKSCAPPAAVEAKEMGQRYRDLCGCCVEKKECRDAEECKCAGDEEQGCCSPLDTNGSKCCTHKSISRTESEHPVPSHLASQERVSECNLDCKSKSLEGKSAKVACGSNPPVVGGCCSNDQGCSQGSQAHCAC